MRWMRIEDCGAGLFKWVIVIHYMIGVAGRRWNLHILGISEVLRSWSRQYGILPRGFVIGFGYGKMIWAERAILNSICIGSEAKRRASERRFGIGRRLIRA